MLIRGAIFPVETISFTISTSKSKKDEFGILVITCHEYFVVTLELELAAMLARRIMFELSISNTLVELTVALHKFGN
jgi:hypothetical protein